MFVPKDPLGSQAGDRLGEAYWGAAKCEELRGCSLGSVDH